MAIRPKSLARNDIHGIIDDQRELHTAHKRIEDKVDQTAEDHTHIIDKIDRNASDLVNLTVALDALELEQRNFFSQSISETSSPRRSTIDDHHIRTSADTRSASIRGRQLNRRSAPRVQRLERDEPPSLQQVRDDIRTTDDNLRRLKRCTEETLRDNRNDSVSRLQELHEDMQRLIARKERLGSIERRLARKSTAQQDDRVEQTPFP
ncbi:hypothetical protein GCK32_018049 [Trichostrongylus colubriformis]|uniref:Uncharacterized protein n=1 Tax=Trichostrongylus colubriformis TaxID=6319 RepID=A0AAN8F4H0_TRICO